MKKYNWLIAALLLPALAAYSQKVQHTYRNCRQVMDSTMLTSPYLNELVQPWELKIKEKGGFGWDYILETSPVFSDLDPLSGNAYSEDYIFLLRETYQDKALPVYTFKIKPSNGKLYELDKASNMWIQRKTNPTLAPIVVALCK